MVRTKNTPSKASNSPPSPSSPGSPAKWTGSERQALFAAIEKHGAGNWTATAACVPGKTAKQCRDQWMKKLSLHLYKACGSA